VFCFCFCWGGRVCGFCFGPVSWLVACLVGWLIGWLLGWLVDMADRLYNRLLAGLLEFGSFVCFSLSLSVYRPRRTCHVCAPRSHACGCTRKTHKRTLVESEEAGAPPEQPPNAAPALEESACV
jgi:hypothetical protein